MNLREALALGVALCKAGKLGEAEQLYESVLKKTPRQFDSLLNLGRIFLRRGDPDQAIDLLRQAVEVNPQVPEAHAELANALTTLGHYEEAIAVYQQAIALQPDNADTQMQLGIGLQMLGRHEPAIGAYRQAIALRPHFPTAYNNLGTALGHAGRLDEAVDSFRTATTLDPGFPDGYNNLALALRKQGKLEEAVAAQHHWIRLKPDNAAAHDQLGIMLQALGRYGEALEAHKAAAALAPGSSETYDNLGNALFNLNRHEEAISCYQRAITLQPDYALAYANLGLTFGQLGRRTEALPAFEKSVELAPENVGFHYMMMDAKRFAVGDPQLATLERLAETIASRPVDDQIKLHFTLAKACDDLGEYRRAFEHLTQGNALMRHKVRHDAAATREHFDHIRAVFTPELMRAKAGMGHPSARPIFIIGMPRSGTTLVEQILASHPRVFPAGELTNIGDTIAAAKASDGHPLSYPDLARSADRTQLFELGAAYIASLPGPLPSPERITDKMPGNFVFAGLIHLALPHARIIHLRRDPRDTCFSCFSKLFLTGHLYSYSLDDLAGYYREYERLMAHWRAVLPAETMLEIQYEELVADFEPQARRLLAHCGLEWDDRCLTFHKAARPIRTPSASQVRRPLYTSSIGRWRAYEDMLGPLLRALAVALLVAAVHPPLHGPHGLTPARSRQWRAPLGATLVQQALPPYQFAASASPATQA